MKTPQWRIDQITDLPANEANCSTCKAKNPCIHNNQSKGFLYGVSGEVTGYVTYCTKYEGKYKVKQRNEQLSLF